MHKAKFITFEGIEGSGKSTQTRLLAEYFTSKNIPYILTREPGGTTEAEQIRNLIVNGEPGNLDKMTELLLVLAARNEHVQKKIKPALTQNIFVICDRFIDSTIAYQGYGQGIDIKIIKQIYQLLFNDFYPDLTFIFDMNVEKALERTKKRNMGEDKFEKMNIKFHQKVQKAFLNIAENNTGRCILLDGENDLFNISSMIIEIINDKFKLFKTS